MAYTYFSRNGELLPIAQALVSLSDIHYTYGFGVYETIRVAKGFPRFPDEHCERLMASAEIIGLAHTFTADAVRKYVTDLIHKNEVENCNIKILLIGGAAAENAALNMLCLNPRYPDRKLYKQGVHMITKQLERPFPHAKTLNMLPSYLAHREAKAAGAYDALLVNRRGAITEATGANILALRGQVISSPPKTDILLGVTRDKVLHAAKQHGFSFQEQELKAADLPEYDNLFLTSTSAKIMPIRSIDNHTWDRISPALRTLMEAFDTQSFDK